MKSEITYLDLFSGLGAFAKGLQDAGFFLKDHYFCEVDKYAIANYKYNFKTAKYVGSIQEVCNQKLPRPDIITFGSPCQDLSIVADRKGLRGNRSGLFFEAVKVLGKLRPSVFIFENVQGLLTSNQGKDFEIVLQTIADLGLYECQWQLVNTAWFLPQSRQRIYLVGYLRDEKAGRQIFPLRLPAPATTEVPKKKIEILDYLKSNRVEGQIIDPSGLAPALLADNRGSFVFTNEDIRRLTPLECERLQGLPDHWTRFGIFENQVIPISDTQRYTMLGNAVSKNVVAAIGRQMLGTSLDGIGTMKTPISYYGGKQAMLKHILPLIPEHQLYVEPFFGGGAVFWAKEPSKAEIINDYNGNVVIFYDQLKRNFPALKKLVDATPYSREVYKQAMVIYHCPLHFEPVQRAWAFWMGTVQGFSHMIGTWRSSGADGREARLNNNKKEAFDRSLSDRLKHTQIENKDAVELIKTHDSKDTFFYLDPPYVGTLMGHYGGYTQEHFDQLLEALSKIKGKFLLSSFPNETLNKYIKKYGWHTTAKTMHKSASPINKTKKEVLTANFPIDKKSLSGLESAPKGSSLGNNKPQNKDAMFTQKEFEALTKKINLRRCPIDVAKAIEAINKAFNYGPITYDDEKGNFRSYDYKKEIALVNSYLEKREKATKKDKEIFTISKKSLEEQLSQIANLKRLPDDFIYRSAITVLRELMKSPRYWKQYQQDEEFKKLVNSHYTNFQHYLKTLPKRPPGSLGTTPNKTNSGEEKSNNPQHPPLINREKLKKQLSNIKRLPRDLNIKLAIIVLRFIAKYDEDWRDYLNNSEHREIGDNQYEIFKKHLEQRLQKPKLKKQKSKPSQSTKRTLKGLSKAGDFDNQKPQNPQKNNAMNTVKKLDSLMARSEKLKSVPLAMRSTLKIVNDARSDKGHKNKYAWDAGYKSKIDSAAQRLEKFLEREELAVKEKETKAATRKKETEKKQAQKKAAAEKAKPKAEKKKAEPKKVELKPTKYMLRNSSKVERIAEELKFIKRLVLLDGKPKTESQIRSFINSLQRAITEKRIRKTSAYAKEIIAVQDFLITEHGKFKGPEDSRKITLPAALKNQLAPLVGKQEILKSVRVIKSYIGMQGRLVTAKRVDSFFKNIERAIRYGEISKRDPYVDEINSIRASVGEFLNSKKESGYLKIPARVLNGLMGIAGVEDDDDWPQGSLDGVNDDYIYESTDIVDMEFDTLGFTGKWYQLIGDPCRGFSMVIYAKPKYGKSNLCLDFAGYLSRNHGRVLYVTGEEKVNHTFQDKLLQRKAAHPNLYATGALPADFSDWDFVILDSLTRLHISADELEALKAAYPDTSFIAVLQVTKEGSARGSNEYIHNADSIVHLPEIGKAVQYGRFNQGGQIQIF